jgi:hypothetical protein
MAQGVITALANSERPTDNRSRCKTFTVTWAATTYTATTISPQLLGIANLTQIEIWDTVDVSTTLSGYLPNWDNTNGVLRLFVCGGSAAVTQEFSGSLGGIVAIRIRFTYFP